MADSSDATDSDAPAGDDSPESESIGLVAARDRAIEAAGELLEHEFEGVLRVENQSDGWRVLVEVVEREAVPDTQDIIGRYEIELDDSGDLTGYGLVERYRRGEMKEEL